MTGEANLHTLGMHANHLARHIGNERAQKALEIVAVTSVIAMGIGAVFHLYKEISSNQERKHYHNIEKKLAEHKVHSR